MRTASELAEGPLSSRVCLETARSQYDIFTRSHCRDFFDALPIMVFALNDTRQIVFANKAGIEFLEHKDVTSLLGLRPGEAVGCINAAAKGGCGSSPHCRNCMVLGVILTALGGGEEASRCNMLRRSEMRLEGLNMLVKATPMDVEGRQYVIFAITDVTHEHRRRAMERIFFHDVLNLAGGLRGLTELMREGAPGNHAADLGILHAGMEALVDEILAQRELSAAESGELTLCVSPVGGKPFLQKLAALYSTMPVAGGKSVAVESSAEDFEIETDARILQRVLGNLVKNALEAEGEGGVVTLSCRTDAGQARFSVHNASTIPGDLQPDIFRRSFSTKRTDRGLGLYSVMLLTERYLNGESGFTSSPEHGTEFFVRLPFILAGIPTPAGNV